MPDLPKVTQDFTANNAQYLAAIQAMIEKTQALSNAIDGAITRVKALQESLNNLDGKQVTVLVNVVTKGDMPKTVQQVVEQVVIPKNANETVTVTTNENTANLLAMSEAVARQVAEFKELTDAVYDDAIAQNELFDAMTETVPLEERAREALKELTGIYSNATGESSRFTKAQQDLAKSIIQQMIDSENLGDAVDGVALRMGIMGAIAKEMADEYNNLTVAVHTQENTLEDYTSAMATAERGQEQARGTWNTIAEAVLQNEIALNALDATEAKVTGDSQGYFEAMWKSAAATKALSTQSEDSGGALTAFGDIVAGLGFKTSNLGYAFGFLGGTFKGILGDIAGWHLAFDAALEATIAITDAALAAAPAIAAMAPAAQDVYNHLVSVHDVSTALGVTLPPLTGWFENMQHAMAPTVVEMYGAALNTLNSQNLRPLTTDVKDVSRMFLDWEIAIEQYMNKQGGLNKILSDGRGYLAQFGQVIGDVLIAIDRLLQASPGTVHFLLDLFTGFAKLLDVVTSIPTPILTVAIALHSLYIWGDVLLTWAAQLSQWFVRLAANAATFIGEMAALAVNPMTWIVLAAAGMAAFVYEATQATTSAKNFIAAWQNTLSNDSPAQAILDINTAMAQTAVKAQQSQVAIGDMQIKLATSAQGAYNDLTDVGKAIVTGGASVHTVERIWDDLFGAVHNAVDAQKDYNTQTINVAQQENALSAYNNFLKSLTADQKNLFLATAYAMKNNQLTYTQALGLMQVAGVQYNDSLATMEAKINALVTGYKQMGVAAGLLGNAENAITFQTEQANSKISAITQGFTNFINTVTGGESAFTTFQQQMQSVFQGLSGAATTLTTQNGKVSVSVSGAGNAAAAAATQLNGLTTADLSLRQSFTQAVTDGTNVINSLLTMASAAGLGAKGTDMVTQAGKDLVAQLLPVAAQSKTATAELYAMAQTAGYQGADSFKALAQWVGNTVNPAKNLNQIEQQLTVASANLAKDTANLADAIGTNLSGAMATAIVQANGGTGAFLNFANAIHGAHGNIAGLIGPAQNLATMLYNDLGKNLGEAHNEFDTFAIAMGLSKAAADSLWGAISGSLTPALNSVPSASKKAADAQQAVIDKTKSLSKELGDNLPQSISQANSAMDNMKNSHLSPLTATQQANIDKTQAMAKEMGSGLPSGLDQASSAMDNTKNSHLTPLTDTQQANIDKTQAMAKEMGDTLPSGLGQADSAIDNTKNSHLVPLQSQTEANTNKTDALAREMGITLPSGLGSANAASDNSRNAHLTPLQQLIAAIKTLVGELETVFKSWPGSESTHINLSASGSATIKSNAPGVPAYRVAALAGGGIIPGYAPGDDRVPAMLSPGEGILTPQAVRMIGPGTVHSMNRAAQHFAAGGIAGANATMSSVVDAAENTRVGWGNDVGTAFKDAVVSAFQAVQKGVQQVGSGTSIPFHGSLNLIPYFQQAMSATGAPASWLNDLLVIASYESGLNVNAINLTDSNAAAGDPSRGLMQVIMTTFDAYHQPGTSWDIYNPVANIAAAINYIRARYGSVFNVPGIVSLSHGGGYVGYDSGGLLMPGLTLAYNGTGAPEKVTPGGMPEGPIELHVPLVVNGQTIAKAVIGDLKTEIARYSIRQSGNSNRIWQQR